MDILFWSGGKDAFLAYTFYRQTFPNQPLKLLTTYNETTDMVPHQMIAVDHIKVQAEALDTDLILVSLPADCPNDVYLNEVGGALSNQPEAVKNLVFGDWYLQDIRRWREQQFEDLGFHCRFPIWRKNLHELLPVLLLKPIEVRISAVSEDFEKYIQVGELYHQQFVKQLPGEIDPMGEKGEFHTEVRFK